MTTSSTSADDLTMRRPDGGPGERALGHPVSRAIDWQESLGLAAILILAAVLDFFQLSRNGFANTYYAAAVRSMSESWHNFFFSSFDPGGYVTIDKPPVGFWFQVLSVKLFGFHGTSLLFPEALAGVFSVALLFYLVRRSFGSLAGLIAGLALAVTPISVATNRNNTIDGLLAFTLLLAAGAVVLALQQGRLRWLLLAMALVGVGFNIKMAESLVALPAFGLAYFLAAPIAWRTRVLHLIAAGLVLVVVALSWVTMVDLIPASQRPYIGSSQHNSELELAIGYNGINRLLPRRLFGARPALPPQRPVAVQSGPQGPAGAPVSTPRPQGAQFRGPGFGAGNGGLPAALHLFTPQLAGQLSWLMPLAAVGLLAAAWQTPLTWRPDPRQRALLLWVGWFLCCGALFTFDEAARPYYMVTLAPATAALAGIGVAALWHDYREHGLRGWLLPFALAATAVVEAFILRPYPDWNRWLTPLTLGAAGAAAIILLLARLSSRPRTRLLGIAACALGVLALFVAPAIWSGVTVARAAPGGLPTAGPLTAGFGFFGARPGTEARGRPNPGPDAGVNLDPKLLAYLEEHRDGAEFLLATTNAQAAAPFILQTGQPVMALGGFTGSDPVLTPDQLAQKVKDGTVRFFLMSGAPNTGNPLTPATGRGFRTPDEAPSPALSPSSPGQVQAFQPPANRPALAAGGFPGFFGRGNGLQSWVSTSCSAVPAADWRSSTEPAAGNGFGAGFGFGGGGNQQLYDCASA